MPEPLRACGYTGSPGASAHQAGRFRFNVIDRAVLAACTCVTLKNRPEIAVLRYANPLDAHFSPLIHPPKLLLTRI